MLNQHREKFQQLSIKIGVVFSKTGLSPNQWTLLSVLPAIACFYLLTQNNFLAAAAFFAAAAFLDFVDGSVARVTGRVTKFGAYLDTITDRYIELLIILGIFFIPLQPFFLSIQAWLLLYLFGSTMTTYAKAAAKEKDLVKKELKGGTLERAERMILLFAGILAANYNSMFLGTAIVALAIGSNLTALQRILKAMETREEAAA